MPNPPKVEKNVLKFIKQREKGGKAIIDPDTQAEISKEALQKELERLMRRRPAPQPEPGLRILGELKSGGMIKKTGVYKLHKGEMVVPVKNVEKVKKAIKSTK